MPACVAGGLSFGAGASGCHEVDVRRDADYAYVLNNRSLYFNASYRTGRGTINGGVR